jgi:pimeloyl-ACP methyl ester carboxylesterase
MFAIRSTAFSLLAVALSVASSPAMARYLESDPIGQAAGPSTYGYVSGNPLGRTDPQGLVEIFVGGARDATNRNVKSYYDTYLRSHSDALYFEWWQESALIRAIRSQKQSEPINLIGHSLGGAQAAWAARYGGRKINLLITIDPVGAMRECPMTKNANEWIDVNALHSGGKNMSDYVSYAGGKWGFLADGRADVYIESPANHGDFREMMQTPGSDGLSVEQILGGGP